MAKLFLGTSGFSYPHWGRGIFYPKGLPQSKWLEYYIQHFNAVELNVSFYRLPKKEVFARWRKRASKDFTFAIKGSRYITHIKRLKDCQKPSARFFQAAAPIKAGKEVVLFQLPPRFKANLDRLESFLKLLPQGWRYAFEFREESWLENKAFKILAKAKAAAVFQDYPDWPMTEKVTANFVYLRFHGKTHLYTSCYTEKELTQWAKKIRAWLKKNLDCYVFFNNDALGHAVKNAAELKARVTKE